eukprot:scaffold145451_cov17-Tisochrysis_lutea.AAC.1
MAGKYNSEDGIPYAVQATQGSFHGAQPCAHNNSHTTSEQSGFAVCIPLSEEKKMASKKVEDYRHE